MGSAPSLSVDAPGAGRVTSPPWWFGTLGGESLPRSVNVVKIRIADLVAIMRVLSSSMGSPAPPGPRRESGASPRRRGTGGQWASRRCRRHRTSPPRGLAHPRSPRSGDLRPAAGTGLRTEAGRPAATVAWLPGERRVRKRVPAHRSALRIDRHCRTVHLLRVTAPGGPVRASRIKGRMPATAVAGSLSGLLVSAADQQRGDRDAVGAVAVVGRVGVGR